MPWIDLPANYTPPRVGVREQDRWYEFRNQSEDEAELLIFSEIGWWGILADEFVEELKAVTARKLTVRVNSPGGSVFQGVAIGNALRAHPASVTVRVEGLAASIASVIALAGDRLIMAPNSMFMIHDASGATWGDAAELRKMAEILDKISDNIADAYAAKAGGTRAEWRERMLAETWYTAEEAVEAGLADELMVPPQRDDPDGPDDATKRMTARWDLSVFRYAGRENAPAPAQSAVAVELHVNGAWTDITAHAQGADDALAPTDQAPAPSPPSTPITAHPHPTAGEQPGPAPELPEPGPAEPDDWAALTAHLLPPAEPSAEDLLAHLREA
ncbi:head maturation protease, ClpP-related [Nonomuraea polychroma]|uniref:head maturation protease, ClpP-related n=1 Tax=Nonomuraea polychroma TaxID=46176 RepID=UPI003D934F78